MIVPIVLAQKIDIRSNLGPKVQLDLGTLIGRYAGLALAIASVAALAYMVLGGFMWIIASGDKGKIDSAKQMITQGLIGLAVMVSVFAVFRIINYFFGLDITIVNP